MKRIQLINSGKEIKAFIDLGRDEESDDTK